MELKDAFLTPIYIFLIYMIAIILRSRMVKNPVLKKYYIPGLTLKLIGGLSLGLIYQFYYNFNGDTFAYFNFGSKYIYQAFTEHPIAAFKLIMDSGENMYNTDPDVMPYLSKMYFYGDPPSYFVVRVSGLFGLFSFHSYAVNTAFFALFSFLGTWALFITFCKIRPQLHKEFAIATFGMPSIFFWGSGILKDSITFGALGVLVYSFYNLFVLKEKNLKNILLLILSAYILKIVKVYILLCFLPAGVIWFFLIYQNRIKSRNLKMLAKPFLIVMAFIVGFFITYKVSEDNNSYRLDNLANTAKITSSYIYMTSKEQSGSAYSLGDYTPTLLGVLQVFPSAVCVSLFRPYIWEIRNPLMLISSLESLALLILTILAFKRTGIVNSFKFIKQDSFVLFSLIFSISFAFAVGLSSYNFGTLARYKIPLIPFYVAAILMIRRHGTDLRKKRINARRPIMY